MTATRMKGFWMKEQRREEWMWTKNSRGIEKGEEVWWEIGNRTESKKRKQWSRSSGSKRLLKKKRNKGIGIGIGINRQRINKTK